MSQFTISVIIPLIKSSFFSKVDNYNLEQNFTYIKFFFCDKIINVVYMIFAIVRKNLMISLINLNL